MCKWYDPVRARPTFRDGSACAQSGMTQSHLLVTLRTLVEGSWQEVVHWLAAKPGVFTLPRPEQQIAFELADRVRRGIRQLVGNASWDRLYFDPTTITLERAPASFESQRAPIYIDTRQLFGIPAQAPRDPSAPDLAISVQVLRAGPALLELDDDGRPKRAGWVPTSLRMQGSLLEQHVALLEGATTMPAEGFLFVIYSNEARRRSSVDLREVASWASWNQRSETFWWATRHFRARMRA